MVPENASTTWKKTRNQIILTVCYILMLALGDAWATSATVNDISYYLAVGVVILLIYVTVVAFVLKYFIKQPLSTTYKHTSVASLVGMAIAVNDYVKYKPAFQISPQGWQFNYVKAMAIGRIYFFSMILFTLIFFILKLKAIETEYLAVINAKKNDNDI